MGDCYISAEAADRTDRAGEGPADGGAGGRPDRVTAAENLTHVSTPEVKKIKQKSVRGEVEEEIRIVCFWGCGVGGKRGGFKRSGINLHRCLLLPPKKPKLLVGDLEKTKRTKTFCSSCFETYFPPARARVCVCGARYRDSVSVGRKAETGRHISLPSWQPGQSVCMKPPVTHLL